MRSFGSLRGEATSTYAAWIAAAFVMTALWALVVVVNKKILESVTPVAVNFFIRLAAIGGLLAITVPLTVFGLWDNGFGINAEAAGWIALSAVGTWVIAFNAYYFALRGERVAVIAPITSTDPVWTAFFAWVIVGAAFGVATLAGMAVTMAGVVLISRWMDDGEGAPGSELTRAATLAAGAHGDVLPGDRVPDDCLTATLAPGSPAPHALPSDCPAPPARTTASKARLIGLAVLTAAGWGLGPVLIDLAAESYGRATATMMLLSQVCGALMLGALLLWRRPS